MAKGTIFIKAALITWAALLVFNLRPVSAAEQTAKELDRALQKLYDQGRVGEAIPVAKRLISLKEKELGDEDPEVVMLIRLLARLYSSEGQYAEAEPLLRRALETRKAWAGEDSLEVAGIKDDLASLLLMSGNMAEAEALYKEALRTTETWLGQEDPGVAKALNNLAAFYNNIGDHKRALSMFKRALGLHKKAHGTLHRDVASTLNNIGYTFFCLENYEEAERHLKNALEIQEKILGSGHPDTTTTLNNLAGVYAMTGRYLHALPLLKRAVSINEKALGPDHPGLAQYLLNLGGGYLGLGMYSDAEPLLRRALHIAEKSLGPDHPQVAANLMALSVCLGMKGEHETARRLGKRAQEIADILLDQVAGFTSEQQTMNFLASQRVTLNIFLSLILQDPDRNSAAARDALDVWIRKKGAALEAQKRFQEALVTSGNPEGIALLQALSRVRSRLSRLSFKGPGPEGAKAYRENLARLRQEKERLEAKLSRASQAFAQKRRADRADSEDLAQILPRGSALLVFARIRFYNLKATTHEEYWLPDRYLAFVLHSGRPEEIVMKDLGMADRMDQAVSKLKREIARGEHAQAMAVPSAARRLHDLIFSPLKEAIGTAQEIFVSPDGNLNLIPFEVLMESDGRYLIEDYTFNYLAAARDLAGFGGTKGKGGKALLIGDPDFDMKADERSPVHEKASSHDPKKSGKIHRSDDFRALRFSRLPGTREEVEKIRDILGRDKARLVTGRDALEEVLMQEESPEILHLATHGFFLEDAQRVPLHERGGLRGLQMAPVSTVSGTSGAGLRNPLLRSGIALAGANNALTKRGPETNDGLVTAEKILGLRLQNTRLVVLSACETGVGEVRTGEGVFGLRRAFTRAGADALVMSMWPVPDRETRELMVDFYRKARKGMNPCRALRLAALDEMKRVKKRYGNANPFYWGAFVFMGEP